MYLITEFQGWVTNVLHGVLIRTTYEENFEALEDCFRDQHLAAAYLSQLKMRTQDVRESLQEFVTAVEQLACFAYTALPEDHLLREAGKAFTVRIENVTIKIQPVLGREKTVNKVLRQALEL
jgi:hypothetical protein